MENLYSWFNAIQDYYYITDIKHFYFMLVGLVILLAISIAYSILLAKMIRIKEIVLWLINKAKEGYSSLDKDAKSNLIRKVQLIDTDGDYKIKFSFIEKLDLMVVERSNIRAFIPFFNIYVLIMLMMGVYSVAFVFLYSIFSSFTTALFISIIFGLFPVIILDLMAKYNTNKMRVMTSDFLSVLLSFLEIKNDLLYALDKTSNEKEMYLKEPLRVYVEEAVVQIKNGIDMNVSLDVLYYKVNTKEFYKIILNFKQALKSRGNLCELVRNLEEESLALEEEFNKRKMSIYVTRILLNVFILFSLFVFYYSLFMDSTLKEIYLMTDQGQIIMNVASIFFVIGFMVNLKIGDFDY